MLAEPGLPDVPPEESFGYRTEPSLLAVNLLAVSLALSCQGSVTGVDLRPKCVEVGRGGSVPAEQPQRGLLVVVVPDGVERVLRSRVAPRAAGGVKERALAQPDGGRVEHAGGGAAHSIRREFTARPTLTARSDGPYENRPVNDTRGVLMEAPRPAVNNRSVDDAADGVQRLFVRCGGRQRHGCENPRVAKERRGGAPRWPVRDPDELARREARRAMIAGARASAQSVSRDGRTYKLVKLPPELGLHR